MSLFLLQDIMVSATLPNEGVPVHLAESKNSKSLKEYIPFELSGEPE
jgi:hypothetical protein